MKTAYELRISDWSSDVCSSDLNVGAGHRHLQLLPNPRTDEVGGVLSLFDRVFEIMRALDEFELLVGRAEEIENLARVARENAGVGRPLHDQRRSEEHTSELQSLMRISYAVFCLKKKNKKQHNKTH